MWFPQIVLSCPTTKVKLINYAFGKHWMHLPVGAYLLRLVSLEVDVLRFIFQEYCHAQPKQLPIPMKGELWNHKKPHECHEVGDVAVLEAELEGYGQLWQSCWQNPCDWKKVHLFSFSSQTEACHPEVSSYRKQVQPPDGEMGAWQSTSSRMYSLIWSQASTVYEFCGDALSKCQSSSSLISTHKNVLSVLVSDSPSFLICKSSVVTKNRLFGIERDLLFLDRCDNPWLFTRFSFYLLCTPKIEPQHGTRKKTETFLFMW